MVKGILESNGIESMIKNERGSASAGVGYPVPFMSSLAYAWPEVWVRDEDCATALQILAEVKERQPNSGVPWTCRQCGESVDAELAACWNCETPMDEKSSPKSGGG